MAKICVKCGNFLEEGEACECQRAAGITKSRPIIKESSHSYTYVHNNTSEFEEYFKKMWRIILQFVKSPAGVTKKMSKRDDFLVGLIFIGIQAIITGIFVLAITKNTVSTLFGGSETFWTTRILGGPGFGFYFGLVMKTILFIGIQFLLLVGINFILGKLIFKSKVNIKNIISVFGVASIPLTAVLVISTLFAFIFSGIVIYFIYFGIITTLILNYLGVKEALNVSEDQAIYVISPAYVGYLYLCTVIIQQFI